MWIRWKHHLWAVAILAGTGLWTTLIPPWAEGEGGQRLLPILMRDHPPGTLGTRFFGYGALVLLGLALVIGPLTRLHPRLFARWLPYRRAIGVWSALSGVAHLLFVLQMVSFEFYRRTWLTLFVTKTAIRHPNGTSLVIYRLPLDSTSLVAWLGLIALLLLLLIALVSNDRAVRLLGMASWKLVQQWAYTAFLFVALHLLVMKYANKLKLSPPLTRWALWLILLVALLQAAGFLYTIWRRGKQSSDKRSRPA